MDSKSILKKRSYAESFGQYTYEDERYSENVRDDYFKKGGIGHGVYQSCIQTTTKTTTNFLKEMEKKYGCKIDYNN